MALWGRPEISSVVKEATGRGYNEKVYGHAFFVNARARPTQALVSLASKSEPFAAVAGRELVAARLDTVPFKPGVISRGAVASLTKKQRQVPLPQDSLFGGYWEMVESNGLAIAEQARRFEDSLSLPRAVEVRGPTSNLMLHPGVEIEGQVTLDARLGPIVMEQGATVESFSRVMGPCYIGQRTKLMSALVGGGTSIYESCKIGGQVENSIFLPYSNKAHHGYVGDSYVGSWVNLGAGCTFSNLKNTYGNVKVRLAGKRVDSRMVKLGPVVGDMSKLSIGALVHAGKSVGTGSHVSGLASDDVPSFTYYDSVSGRRVELLLDSVLETQRRMMERRGLAPTRAEESLIRKAFQATAGERRRARVRKGGLR